MVYQLVMHGTKWSIDNARRPTAGLRFTLATPLIKVDFLIYKFTHSYPLHFPPPLCSRPEDMFLTKFVSHWLITMLSKSGRPSTSNIVSTVLWRCNIDHLELPNFPTRANRFTLLKRNITMSLLDVMNNHFLPFLRNNFMVDTNPFYNSVRTHPSIS